MQEPPTRNAQPLYSPPKHDANDLLDSENVRLILCNSNPACRMTLGRRRRSKGEKQGRPPEGTASQGEGGV